jgi:hypothetical protein
MTGGECVDGGLVWQHVDLRLADPRRDGHLLDDVHEPLSLEIAVAGIDLYATERARDRGAAGTQL